MVGLRVAHYAEVGCEATIMNKTQLYTRSKFHRYNKASFATGFLLICFALGFLCLFLRLAHAAARIAADIDGCGAAVIDRREQLCHAFQWQRAQMCNGRSIAAFVENDSID